MNTKNIECNCNGNCLTLNCPCFKQGCYCSKNCKCKGCKNCEECSRERINAIEQILAQNPMAFTTEDTLTPEEFSSISNFAMLTSSVDSEEFSIEPRETKLSKVLTQQVVKQAILTIISAGNESDVNQENLEEKVENQVNLEFEIILNTILKSTGINVQDGKNPE